jgi:hypothetical protein
LLVAPHRELDILAPSPLRLLLERVQYLNRVGSLGKKYHAPFALNMNSYTPVPMLNIGLKSDGIKPR